MKNKKAFLKELQKINFLAHSKIKFLKSSERTGLKNEKKALVLSTVVGLIILILGFAILAFAFFQVNWTGDINRDVCHQSVIYRATLPGFANMKNYVPLKCQTEKICITAGFIGGKCKEFENMKGVSNVKVADREDAEQVIAKEIVSCWEMMGGGKVGLFNDWFVQTYGFGTITSSCVICSRIAFDKENLNKSGIDVNEINVRNYMITHRMPNKEVSYFVYLTGTGGLMSVNENNGMARIDNVIQNSNNNSANIQTEDIEISEDSGENDSSKELAVMFMQVQSPQYKDVFMNNIYTLIGVGGGGFAVAPKYTTKAVTTLGKSPYFWIVMALAGVYQYASVRSNQAMTAGYCGDVSIGDKATTGCSVVRTVNYGADDLSQYCSRVESIP